MTHTTPVVIIFPASPLLFSKFSFLPFELSNSTIGIIFIKKNKPDYKILEYTLNLHRIFCNDDYLHLSTWLIFYYFIEHCISYPCHIKPLATPTVPI